jgi:predicted metal-dependent enzyme (double-stranded beta helix superfamily)
MSTSRPAAFEKFIRQLRAAWAELPDTEARMRRAAEALAELLRDPELRERSKTWPSTEGHKNLLLYEDPDYGFVVNGVVRAPQRKGAVHDHAHAWTAYGVLDGTERLERYRVRGGERREGRVEIELESVREGVPGTVDLVPPYAIHSEKGGPTRSVAVIVRSERLVGRTLQGRYDPESGRFTQGEGPTQVPFEI